jgi:hypothetical protein
MPKYSIISSSLVTATFNLIRDFLRDPITDVFSHSQACTFSVHICSYVHTLCNRVVKKFQNKQVLFLSRWYVPSRCCYKQ